MTAKVKMDDYLYKIEELKIKNNFKFNLQNNLLFNLEEYLVNLGSFKDNLVAIDSKFNDINNDLIKINDKLSQLKYSNKLFIDNLTSLYTKQSDLERQQSELQSFIDKFTLSDKESTSLLDNNHPIDDTFISSLTRLSIIRDDAQLLLNDKDNDIGLEILSMSSHHFEVALNKLLKWLKFEFTSKFNRFSIEIKPLHIQSLKKLAIRDDLYLEALQFLTLQRKNLLERCFLDALTEFENNQDIITDPIKYSTELLAWLHQHAADEKDFLCDLLDTDDVNEQLSNHLQPLTNRIQVGNTLENNLY